MAFEAFLTSDKGAPKKWKRITATVSIGVHVVALGAGAIHSIWHVDELSPPNVTVTFLSSAPPPPPPPPPPKKKSSTTKTKVKPTEVIQPTKPTEIVQPREQPKEEPKKEEEEDDGEEDGEEGGVEGGVKGGVAGGVIGGTVGGTVGGVLGSTGTGDPPKMLPPNVGESQILQDVQPSLPEAMRRAGMIVFVMAKICVNVDGSVKDVSIMKSAGDPAIDTIVKDAYKQRKYKPYAVNGRPVPFCHPIRVSFNTK